MHAAVAYFAFAIGLLLADQSLRSYFLGINRGMFWDEAYREESPVYYWFCWWLWTAAAAVILGASVYRTALATASAASTIVDQLQAMTLPQKLVYLVVPTSMLGVMAWRWMKAGNPADLLRYFRENYELRKELVLLIGRADTGMEGVTMKEFMNHAGNHWLRDIARYLRQLPAHQRSLKEPISATSDP